MSEAEELELKEKLREVTAERNKYHAELTDLRIKRLEDRQQRTDDRVEDHEDRMRVVETIGTRFNTIYAMFAGNSLMSIIALIKLFAQP